MLSMKKMHLNFYTWAEYTVFLSFRHGFASTEKKPTLDHQYKYDGKTAFVSLGKALWKTAWQKILLAYDFGGTGMWFPLTQTKAPGVDIPTAASFANIILVAGICSYISIYSLTIWANSARKAFKYWPHLSL